MNNDIYYFVIINYIYILKIRHIMTFSNAIFCVKNNLAYIVLTIVK